jgi:signal transduction histidine kinase
MPDPRCPRKPAIGATPLAAIHHPVRISTKISLSFTVVGLVVFGGLGLWQLRAEKRDLESAAIGDATTLARAAAESARQDLGEGDPEDSTALLHSLERFDTRFDAVLWSEQRPRWPTDAPREIADAVDSVGRTATAGGGPATRIVHVDGGGRVAIVGAPVDALRSHSSGAIVLVRPLDDVDADLQREGSAVAIAVLAFSLFGGLVGFVLGESYIGRPLARLDRAMSVVGAGDFEIPLPTARADEVGRVLGRFDQMRRELSTTQRRLQSEENAHRATRDRLADLDRLVTVGQLSAGLAHEIGSPLQILRARAEKLTERAGSDAGLAASARTIAEQAERIERIVGQLLQFARPRSRELRATDPATCVGAVVDLLTFEARRRAVELELDATRLPMVFTDADALQQIVFNLVRNGIAATGRGGTIRIGLRVDEGPEPPRILRLVVSDNGIGMRPEVRDRAFEPFFTTRGRDGGVGLGLAVVRSLVESLEGSITLESSPREGTEAKVELPC